MVNKYLVIGSNYCPYCIKAKELLESKEIQFEYRVMNEVNSADVAALEEIAGKEFQTVPQVFKYKKGGGLEHIGGYTELRATF